ncbi:hypothetical protein [Cohnella abietis]|uniref:YtxH domain-containing protein n=1 Tax=Cohnella abietis TaxID=2507935 RepID=A0A3T1D1G7_9BACL|nr:hypothetical protein [Cohnella abietis]BBI31898.1 hypothetical protein KCTCHS21_12970 [Cohnella abietis]
MFKSPISLLLAAAGIILAVSPNARKAVRKIAVKGTEWVLDMNDQLKAGIKEVDLANVLSGKDENHAEKAGILSTEQTHIDQ